MNTGKIIFLLALAAVLSQSCDNSALNETKPKQSFFKLPTSNGLIVAVYNEKENRIDDVYPHIFTNYDSGLYVHPFVGNIRLNSEESPVSTAYLDNTHVVVVDYKDFSLYYFASFTREDKIFYIVARGNKDVLEKLSFNVETDAGKPVSGITLLENQMQDLPIIIAGHAIRGEVMRPYRKGSYERYFLYSFTDSLHTDTAIVSNAISQISSAKSSLVDDEVQYMRQLRKTCNIPLNLTGKERRVVEQSITILKMSQVSDKEIFPEGRGQIMASIRPGLWHIAWVRDGTYAIQAMTRLGMFDEAKKGLEFMLQAPSNNYKHYIYNGKDYGPGVDYQVSLTRYFGNGREESDFNEYGPNIEYDDFGLFLCAYGDYVLRTQDGAFYKKWSDVVTTKVADAIVAIIDRNSLVKADSGPWEHHLQMPRQYTFTSGVCARGLEMFASLQQQYGLPYEKYESAAKKLETGIIKNMLVDGRYIKGNAEDTARTAHEYYDGGSFEIFADGLIGDKELFYSHMAEYDRVIRIPGNRSGYIRLISNDPYENQEWVFINLRIAMAYLIFGERRKAGELIGWVTEQASVNNNIIPEMFSNKEQMAKVPKEAYSNDIWCNCIRQESDQYIGEVPMVGYGSGAYIIALYAYYGR